MTAMIFPNKPVGSVPTTVFKTFNFLKSLPDGCKVWHYLTYRNGTMPDFLVLNPDDQAILIKVSDATPKEFKSRLQMMLIGDKNGKVGEKETEILEKFIREVNDRCDGSLDKAGVLKSVVLFPNLDTKQVARQKPSNTEMDLSWLGSEYLSSSKQSKWQKLFPSQPLDDIAYQAIRTLFTPETVVPKTLTVREQSDRNIKAGLEDFLLDYDQEKILKFDLDLPDDVSSVSRDFKVSLVNGVAGSGKTIILLYRLRLLYELYPDKDFLVLTHNRALIRDMQWKYYCLCGDLPDNIEWKTFSQWLHNHWPAGQFMDAIGKNWKEEIIQRIWLEIFSNTSVSEGMLVSEIDWINDQVDRSREAYLSIERRGRGFRLSQNQRNQMYDAYERYLAELRKIKRIDWGLVPHAYLKRLEDTKGEVPKYDVILVDESQFFAPIWFEIIRKMIKPKTGHLFMVADPTQGFLNRGISWKSMGMEVRGRTDELKRSYRTTKEILSLATVFYRQRVPQDTAEEGILEPDILDMPEGIVPQLIQLQSYQAD